MRVLLLNQFTPPESPPTARLLGDLERAMTRAGWEAQCLGCGQGYQKKPKSGARRVLRDLAANFRLLIAGLRAPRCDWVLCLSDPPGLPFTAAVIALCKRARLAHWAMDVYPQTAVALGALRPGLVSRVVRAAMRFGYRRARVLVALDEDMRAVLESAGGTAVRVLPPWPPAVAFTSAAGPAAPASDETDLSQANRTRVWLYSGNLGRAHEFADLLEAQRRLEQEGGGWRLVFQGGGPAREAARQRADELGLRQCEWRDYAPDDRLLAELRQADALIASQKPELTGLIWPSKLALMTLLEKPVLWLGPTDSQVARMLRALSPRHGVFAPGEAEAIAAWLRALPPSPPPLNESEVRARVEAVREQGVRQWLEWGEESRKLKAES